MSQELQQHTPAENPQQTGQKRWPLVRILAVFIAVALLLAAVSFYRIRTKNMALSSAQTDSAADQIPAPESDGTFSPAPENSSQSSETSTQPADSSGVLSSASLFNSVQSVLSSQPDAVSSSEQEEVPAENAIVRFTTPYTAQSLSSDTAALAAKYPSLIRVSSCGTSAAGKPIPLLMLGTGSRKVLLAGGIHAREHITVSYVMRVAEEYAAAAAAGRTYAGTDAAALLRKYTVYIVPCINPDGMNIVTAGEKPLVSVVLSTPGNYYLYRTNANGVDLNRNFPFLWDQIQNGITGPDELHYKGTSAGSEPETQAMMHLCEENSFEWMISMHIKGNCLFWIDQTNGAIPGDETLASRISRAAGLTMNSVSTNVNDYGGGFENWFRSRFGRPAVCAELMPTTVTITPLSDDNHLHFDSVLCWSRTKALLAACLSGS